MQFPRVGVCRRGRGPPVPQHLADLGQRAALGEHGGGGAVPQPVRVDRAQPGPPGSGGHRLGDPARCQALMRRLDPGEHAAVQRRGWPAVLQPLRDRLARVSWQRQPVTAVSLAADGDLAAPPVDVVQAQSGDLACPQPHPG